jgi:hypothetical protein
MKSSSSANRFYTKLSDTAISVAPNGPIDLGLGEPRGHYVPLLNNTMSSHLPLTRIICQLGKSPNLGCFGTRAQGPIYKA